MVEGENCFPILNSKVVKPKKYISASPSVLSENNTVASSSKTIVNFKVDDDETILH